MAKLSEMSLPELYDRRITGATEKAILEKENFEVKSNLWCDKACRLTCKNPPSGEMFSREQVDVLIIQDVSAFDEPKFRKQGAAIERKHREIISHIARSTLHNGTVETAMTFAVTNLLKCNLQPGDIKKGKAPTDTVLMKCRPYLLEEIRQRKPKVIISLSKAATNAMGFKKSNSRDQGDILSLGGTPVVLTLHPRILVMLRQNSSGAFWGSDFYSIIERDFMKAAQIVNGKLGIPNLEEALEEAKTRIHIARSLDDVKAFCKLLTEVGLQGIVESFDTETTGLDPFAEDAKIICMQFGFRNQETLKIEAYVFPMFHRNNVWYDPKEAWGEIRPILLNEKIKKVGHNFKFDCMYVEATLGIRIVGILFDTMLLMHAVNSGIQGCYGLKRAVGNYLPESGLQGYEECLPKLTKKKKEGQDGIAGDEEGEEDEEDNGRDAH